MAKIKLPNGLTTFVDDDIAVSFEWKNAKVHLTKGNHYVYFVVNRKLVYLHRAIMGSPEGLIVDHKNRDSLNNLRENLRICTKSENARNKRKTGSLDYKGINIKKRKSEHIRYVAVLVCDGISYRSLEKKTQIEAALEYDKLAIKHHGEFACTNKMLGLL